MTATIAEPLTSSRELSGGDRPRRGRVTVVANLKGGVGKTTTAVNLACGLARGIRRPGSTEYEVPPQKTLLLDFESLCTATKWLGIVADEPSESVSLLFQDPPELAAVDSAVADEWQRRLLSVVHSAKNEPVFLVPAHTTAIDLVDGDKEGSEYALADNLEYFRRHFDHIIIDTPGQLRNRMLRSALVAADGVLIPVMPTPTVLISVSPLFKLIKDIKRGANRGLQIDGWLISNAGHRNDADALLTRRALQETPGVYTFQTAIRTLKAISRASALEVSVFGMENNEEAVRDYEAFLREWYERISQVAYGS